MGITNNITFKRKPIPVPSEYRPLYKIAQIVLILKLNCNKNTSSLLKLHLFSWAMKSEDNFNKLKNLLNEDFKMNSFIWTIEPALNRGLEYALAEKICILDKGKYLLTEKGEKFYKMIIEDSSLFNIEQKLLDSVGKKISETTINNIYKPQ